MWYLHCSGVIPHRQRSIVDLATLLEYVELFLYKVSLNNVLENKNCFTPYGERNDLCRLVSGVHLFELLVHYFRHEKVRKTI